MSTWWTATVSGIPFSALTSRHSRIASSMFFRASLSVTPWLTHPGIAGHSATKTPSSSRSTVTTNFIRWILLRSTRLHFRGRDSLERPADLLDRDPGLHERLHQKVDRNGLVGRFHLRDARLARSDDLRHRDLAQPRARPLRPAPVRECHFHFDDGHVLVREPEKFLNRDGLPASVLESGRHERTISELISQRR